MSKLIIVTGIIGILFIFFFGAGIGLEEDQPVDFAMGEIDYTERVAPQIPTVVILEVEAPAIEEVLPETKHYSDIVTSHGKPLLQRTDTGENVAELQAFLNEHGASLDIDGVFGDDTRDAVMDFQAELGLEVDGFVGEQTWGQTLDLELEEVQSNTNG